jgi:uncharacterized LabA/DUF88 family protein
VDRICIFIDGSNLFHALRPVAKGRWVDFHRFSQKLCRPDRKLIRTYYYNATFPRQLDEEGYRKRQRFLESLRRVPLFEVRLGRLQVRNLAIPEPCRDCPHLPDYPLKGKDGRPVRLEEKGVDVRIATDLISMAHSTAYDTAILVSGDGDFADAVQAVKDLGKNVEVAWFPEQGFYHLQSIADQTIRLTPDFFEDCWLAHQPSIKFL